MFNRVGEHIEFYHRWQLFGGVNTIELPFSHFANQQRYYPPGNTGSSEHRPGQVYEFEELDILLQGITQTAVNIRIWKQNALGWRYLLAETLNTTTLYHHFDKTDFISHIDRTVAPEERVYGVDIETWDPEDWIIEIETVGGGAIPGAFQGSIVVRAH